MLILYSYHRELCAETRSGCRNFARDRPCKFKPVEWLNKHKKVTSLQFEKVLILSPGSP